MGDVLRQAERDAGLPGPCPESALDATTSSIIGFRPAHAARAAASVLLVEDNSVNRAVAGVFFQRLGYRCDIAHDGEQAVAMAAGKQYDLIFMDVQMPGIDGLEATRRIRASLGPRTPYIVAMTANALPGDRERCMAAGMDDYLVKPTRLEALANVLEPR